MVLVMLGQDFCLNSGQEHMDSMKSWEGRKECLLCDAECESVSHVLVMCCGIVLHKLALEVPL